MARLLASFNLTDASRYHLVCLIHKKKTYIFLMSACKFITTDCLSFKARSEYFICEYHRHVYMVIDNDNNMNV